MPRFRSNDHAYRSVDVAARRSSRACVNFRPGGTRRSGSIEPKLAQRVPDPRTGNTAPESMLLRYPHVLPGGCTGLPFPEGRGGQGGEDSRKGEVRG